MTVGRLCGDVVVHRLGRRQILVGGGICAASGFALASAGPSWPVSVLGFALVGVGASNVVPVLFTAAGRQTAMPTNLAVAAVTTVGYAGILTGPALIGFVARVSSLPIALLIVALMVSSVAVCAKSVTAE
jgi:MFS family permease